TRWLLDNGSLDPNAVGSASVNLLMLTGTVVGGWQMALAGLAIVNGAASGDESFAEAKLMTARFYALHILPRANGFSAAAMAGPDAVMALSEIQF
ncbi:MAG: acyl-CoA dehydrogenase C-terminal domain-containing protein, partial [Woeseiaceae bacterium]|nr:acyl-CoA dehydrogenase C-terminal domain-containing protein [Woeseiaceae bacterium]